MHDVLTTAAYLRDSSPTDLVKTVVEQFLDADRADPAHSLAAEARRAFRARETGEVVAIRRPEAESERS